ncbi:MAG: rRNA maturation RNase YbeY [Tistlia sp.]|uniref:rRNA maturation RNase YbeY n=1 Tax=Tistlia sp. TaxID=3057121 RepID=UPI0034A4F2D5
MEEPPSSRHELAVLIEDAGWQEALPDAEALVLRAGRAALADQGAPLELSVLLTGDEAVRALNARYRGQDKPTNVLSFPADLAALPGEARLLGDLALAFQTCRREAGEQGKTLAAHLAHLVVHGTLHLLGHDHEAEPEAEAMEARERVLLATLGLPDPYGPDPLEEGGAPAAGATTAGRGGR